MRIKIKDYLDELIGAFTVRNLKAEEITGLENLEISDVDGDEVVLTTEHGYLIQPEEAE